MADLTNPLGLQVYRYGFCDPKASFIATLLRPGDSFVDGGANVGLFTLTGAAAVGPSGRVVACEPAANTMALLRANVALNDVPWVELHQVALTDRPGRLQFLSFGAGSGFSAVAPLDESGATSDEVVAVTLDELATGLPRLRVVKLDLVGAEVLALRGAARLLETVRPVFVLHVEAGHLEQHRTSIDELETLLATADYQVFHLVPGAQRVSLEPVGTRGILPPTELPNVVARPR